ncbi:MAG: GAF domain-containing SpoIIE family protein phosphatase [Bacteroidota bacterium]
MPLSAAHVSTLLEVARELDATIQLEPLLERIEQAGRRILDCERVRIFVYDTKRGDLFARLATDPEPIRFPVEAGIAGAALREDRIIRVADAYTDPRFLPTFDQRLGLRTRSLLVLPMKGIRGTNVGVLQFVNKRDGLFTDVDEEVAEALAGLTGVALQRQLLLREQREKRRLERDLALARRIQASTLPDAIPAVPCYDLAGRSRPATEAGGDAYDFIQLPSGRLAVLLADASGHGVGPALMAAATRAMVRVLVQAVDALSTVMDLTNATLYHDFKLERFVTAFVGLLDADGNRLAYRSGGHAPILVYRAATGTVEQRPATGPPLGILPELPAQHDAALALAPGDVVLLVTDGYHEWANADDELFDIERVVAILEAHHAEGATALLDRLDAALADFGGRQSDDLTAVVIRRID